LFGPGFLGLGVALDDGGDFVVEELERLLVEDSLQSE
jgi:hypothetical protein